MHIYVYIYIYKYIHINIYIYICIYIFICIYMIYDSLAQCGTDQYERMREEQLYCVL